jgi:hypothetical protein
MRQSSPTTIPSRSKYVSSSLVVSFRLIPIALFLRPSSLLSSCAVLLLSIAISVFDRIFWFKKKYADALIGASAQLGVHPVAAAAALKRISASAIGSPKLLATAIALVAAKRKSAASARTLAAASLRAKAQQAKRLAPFFFNLFSISTCMCF